MAYYNGGKAPKEILAELDYQSSILESAYSALGRIYYEAHADDPEEAFRGHVETIRTAKKRAEIYTELVSRMRGVRTCPNPACRAEVPSSSAFCNLCGTKIPAPEPLFDGENVYCDVCGSPMQAGRKFCTNCGAPLPLIDLAPKAEAPVFDAPAAPEEIAEPEAPVFEAQAAPEAVEEPAVTEPEAPAKEEPAVPEAPAEEEPEAPAEEAPAELVCPECGKVLPAGIKFCTGCGHRLDSDDAEPAPAERICPCCGKIVSPTAVFCTGCGTRL